MDEKKIAIKTALENNDTFLSFLKQETSSDDYQGLREKVENGSHPTEDMLYDYVLGWLDEKSADAVRDHIALCGICAGEVLQIRQTEDELREEVNPAPRISGLTLIEKMRGFLHDLPRRRNSWAAGLSLATACLLAYLLIPTPPLVTDLVNESYQTVSAKKIFREKSDERFELPWEKPDHTLAFASPNQHLPYSRAFGAGLWTGRHQLSGQEASLPMPEFLSPKWKSDASVGADNWIESEWENWFRAGRWCFLVHAVCLSEQDMPNAFWKQQGIILNHILKDFAEHPGKNENLMKVVNVSLGRVKSVLENLERGTPDRKQRKALVFELDNLMEYLSPKETDG